MKKIDEISTLESSERMLGETEFLNEGAKYALGSVDFQSCQCQPAIGEATLKNPAPRDLISRFNYGLQNN